ncbi:MAG: epoxyqueuosine reductase QueH [Firmicutes bacterium]|nr:epoxyqueuosine reductase QueH [Bacillota bacterium]
MEKVNYDKVLEEIIKKLERKPKLLLHSCCGPCSSYVITYLKNYFDITILYYNPNVEPKAEYEKRKKEQIKLINELNIPNLTLLDINYENELYRDYIKGHEGDLEGGNRCHLCYELRLKKTVLVAKENNYEYFGTTLTVSPYKNAQILNHIGEKLSQKYKVKWLYSDFKKKDGYKKSIELSKEYNLYRQDYCGCLFSKISE